MGKIKKTCLERIAEIEEESKEYDTVWKNVVPIHERSLDGEIIILADGIESRYVEINDSSKVKGIYERIFPLSSNYYVVYKYYRDIEDRKSKRKKVK